KALRPGGRLLLVEPNWKHRFQGRDASDEYGVTEMGYSPRRLKRLLKEAGFTEITRFHNNRKRLFSNRPREIAAHLAEPLVYRAPSVTPAQGRIGVVAAPSRKPRRRERVQGGGSERAGGHSEHTAPRAQPNARGPSGREQHPEHRNRGRRHGDEVPVEVDDPV